MSSRRAHVADACMLALATTGLLGNLYRSGEAATIAEWWVNILLAAFCVCVIAYVILRID